MTAIKYIWQVECLKSNIDETVDNSKKGLLPGKEEEEEIHLIIKISGNISLMYQLWTSVNSSKSNGKSIHFT